MCLGIAIRNPQNVLARGEHQGFEWIVTNNGRGYRCGYVRIPVGHAWYKNSDPDCEVHGGITFSAMDETCDKGGADDAWWIGFDCAHAWDKADPSLPGCRNDPWFDSDPTCAVRTQNYVEAQCRSLCEQAAAVC